ncbi:MAG: DEAD/DEAH box helicase [Treponema sp.]|jgi:superfamily II DNA/RNA helicase|nr:DEAD/DEAH box helicase [Treponema sp.]
MEKLLREKEAGKKPLMSFGHPLFAECLAERNITSPTDIQARVMPLLCGGKSVIFRSATGTGKTFAYLVPFLERLEGAGGGAPGPRMMICAPTHELCAQIKGEADFLLRGMAKAVPSPALRIPPALLLAGSGNMSRQIESLKKEKPLIVAGNPGRLLKLALMGKLRPLSFRFLVLDEGDRLVSDEMFEETASLVRLLRGLTQGTSCSATLSGKSRERLLSLFALFAGEQGEEGPLVVEEDGGEVLREHIEHWAFFSERRRKIDTLVSFLAAVKPKKALVISGGGGQPGIIFSRLRRAGVRAAALYSGLDRGERKAAVDAFRSGKIPVLVSSDLAARGLDVPGITHVVELDVPEDGGVYIHRAGRTGRAGGRGIMATIGDGEEMRRLERLEKKLGITVYPKELFGGRVTVPSPPAP